MILKPKKNVTVRLNEEQIAWIELRAKEKEKTFSDIIRELIEIDKETTTEIRKEIEARRTLAKLESEIPF